MVNLDEERRELKRLGLLRDVFWAGAAGLALLTFIFPAPENLLFAGCGAISVVCARLAARLGHDLAAKLAPFDRKEQP